MGYVRHHRRADLPVNRGQQSIEAWSSGDVPHQLLRLLDFVMQGAQLRRRQQEEFFPGQRGSVDLVKNILYVLGVRFEYLSEAPNKGLRFLEVWPFSDNDQL